MLLKNARKLRTCKTPVMSKMETCGVGSCTVHTAASIRLAELLGHK